MLYLKQKRKEKNIQYNERVLQYEYGSFTPLVFSNYERMGRECIIFRKRISKVLSEKWDTPQFAVINWVQTKISFAFLKLCLLCLRGSSILN